MASAHDLDLLAARAWPSRETLMLDGWRLRLDGGVTKRANSVLPLGPSGSFQPPDTPVLEHRIATVERIYLENGLRPCFQLTPSAWPHRLPDALRDRGYRTIEPTLVMTASLGGPGAPAFEPWRLDEAANPSEDWIDAWWEVEPRGQAPELLVARAILDRIPGPRLFVEARDEQGVAGVGLGVLHRRWVGVYCMATRARARRRGCGRAVLGRLLAWARGAGATSAFLQVGDGNDPARTLYSAQGFAVADRYHYMVPPPTG